MPGFEQSALTGAVEGFEPSRVIPVLSQCEAITPDQWVHRL